MSTKSLFILLVVFITSASYSQVVNAYAEVTAVASATLTIGTVDESAHTFEVGDNVVLMQMQDNVIGDVTNTATFGALGSINNAGIYEIREIASIVESSGVPTSITLVNTPNFTYNTGANNQVQLISFRKYGSPNYTTTANMSARSWDGEIGGVLAFHVEGALTIAHNLDADLDGFRGAAPNAGGSAGCQGNSNFRVVSQANMADKGESIYKNTTAGYDAGMGRMLNGGGGGNSHNGGGGGGGNYTSGGQGGPGWNNCNPGAGGLGGISLQGQIAVGRVFMGGGGGAGEGNNNLSTDGGNGGGIILINADEIITGTCGGLTISANGEDISFAGNDGGGGGGAAGSIVFQVNTWSVSASCLLTVESNGGDGGDVNNGGTHGGGGGGGQGVIFYSIAEPVANTTTTTDNGTGGCSNNSSPCNSPSGSGGGSDGDGIQELVTGPLPIEITNFSGEIINGQSHLYWTTASEANNDYFNVQHSIDGQNWRNVLKINGAGNSSIPLHYSGVHTNPILGVNYYRLKQTDFNGTYNFEEIIALYYDENEMVVYPNPAYQEVFITKKSINDFEIKIYNTYGQIVKTELKSQSNNTLVMDLSALNSGVYFIELTKNGSSERVKLIHSR
ncbi:MAG: T9SS type A sorting domain-containing protein [Crocinitomicaceae bacterium]